ncbi:hypothetical protein Tco_0093704 [Tanacetum coccineum]
MMLGDQFHIFVCPGVSEPASGMLPYPFAHARLGRSFPNSFQWHAPLGASEFLFWNLHVKVSKEFLFPYPADQALFTRWSGPEVYSRGLLRRSAPEFCSEGLLQPGMICSVYL